MFSSKVGSLHFSGGNCKDNLSLFFKKIKGLFNKDRPSMMPVLPPHMP